MPTSPNPPVTSTFLDGLIDRASYPVTRPEGAAGSLHSGLGSVEGLIQEVGLTRFVQELC